MLNSIPLFRCLDDSEISKLETIAFKKVFDENTLVFNKGDQPDYFYIINKGSVKAVVYDINGRVLTLNILGPGEYIGEISIIDNEPRTSSILTIEKTEFLMIACDKFRQILKNNPDMMFKVLQGTTKLFRRATCKIEGFAFNDVLGRLVRIISEFSESQGEKHIFKMNFSQQELANQVGCSREMMSKILKRLEKDGYISIRTKQIIVRKDLLKAVNPH